MTKFIDSKYVKEMKQTTANLYQHGWDERNGGNVSLRLTQDEVKEFEDTDKTLRTVKIKFNASALAGKYYLVSGS